MSVHGAGLLAKCFPPGPCGVCGADSKGGPIPGICSSCWTTSQQIEEPVCPVCGVPLPEMEESEAHLCGRCLSDPPRFEAHRSVFAYEGAPRQVVLHYKERGRYPLAGFMAERVAKLVRRNWGSADLEAVTFIPSPLRRRLSRGFAPAEILARETARRLGVPCRRALALRRTPSPQKGLTAAQRKRNLRGVFRAIPKKLDAGMLLVDDVMTTGATLREGARVLAAAGVKVRAATFAMTLRRPLDLYSGVQAETPVP